MERLGQSREHGRKKKENGRHISARPTDGSSGIKHRARLRREMFVSGGRENPQQNLSVP